MKQHMLVEGNDLHVVLQVCVQNGLKMPVGFANKEDFEKNFALKSNRGRALGKPELLALMGDALQSPDLQRLGIVLDADKSASSTWQSVCAVLQKYGYATPPAPNVEGTIIEAPNPDLPKIGIWIMPDNESPGEIEDFFLQLIENEDYRLIHAQKSVGELIEQKPELLKESNRSKAVAHTWLAWQDEPGRSMGVALKSSWAKSEHPLATRLAQWFTNTFELED